jgi:ABC-2 type transport system ATP-binding protein
MEEEVFIDVSHINLEYPVRGRGLLARGRGSRSVIRDMSFQLAQGDQITLFGAEGAGKTTLLRMLAGVIIPSAGKIKINGTAPVQNRKLAAGYVSAEESEPIGDTVYEALHGYGVSHGLKNLPAQIGEISEIIGLNNILQYPATKISTVERLRVNVARAALSHSPLIMFDDVADHLGAQTMRHIISALFPGRCVIVATRRTEIAEQLGLTILLLHNATLAQYGTSDEIASAVQTARVIDVWIEGLRYDLLRNLRSHPGVVSVQMLPTSRFAGQRLRITLHSSRYLPSMYDLLSKASLVRVKEIPPSLLDIIERL